MRGVAGARGAFRPPTRRAATAATRKLRPTSALSTRPLARAAPPARPRFAAARAALGAALQLWSSRGPRRCLGDRADRRQCARRRADRAERRRVPPGWF